MKQKAFRRQLYHVLNPTGYSSWSSKLDQILLSILIVLDISSFILETSSQLNQQYYWFFRSIAIFSTGVFTIEYGLIRSGNSCINFGFLFYLFAEVGI